MDEIHTNRIKHNMCAVSIEKLTKTGKDVKTYAAVYFGNEYEHIGDIIDASPVIYDSGGFQRKTWALYEHFVSPEDFTENNEVMLIKVTALESLFKKMPAFKKRWYGYFNCFVLKTSKTISQDDIQEAINEINRICEVQEQTPIESEVILTPSVEKECLLGFVPRKELYDIVNAHNSSYIINKSKQKCKIVDGELRIKLW